MTQLIVDTARTWIGTPYVHQSATCGVGTDCLGLIRGIWREVLGPEPVTPPPYTKDWDEAGGQDLLLQAARDLLVERPIKPAFVGDVLLFRMRKGCVAKHLGVQSQIGDTPYFIHAYGGHAVTESPLSAPWQRRIAARFRFPLKG